MILDHYDSITQVLGYGEQNIQRSYTRRKFDSLWIDLSELEKLIANAKTENCDRLIIETARGSSREDVRFSIALKK